MRTIRTRIVVGINTIGAVFAAASADPHIKNEDLKEIIDRQSNGRKDYYETWLELPIPDWSNLECHWVRI